MKNLRINYKTIFILAFILIIYRANAQLLTGLILFPNDEFDIPETGKITLEILDVKGKVLNTLINKYLFAGSYTIKWDAGLHPEGAYFFKLTSKDFCKSKAMLIIK